MMAGCSTRTASLSNANSGLIAVHAPLYLLPTPHSRLYVEVDAVEGCEPKDIALQQLEEFLSAHCEKPGGIKVVRSNVIPKEAARRISARALARRYIDGPEKTNASLTAFIYVLYYPGRLGRTPPYAETYPYPAIYFNARFSLGLALNEILLHETGHLLGLVERPVHARNGHCRNYGCQMNTHWAYVREFRWLPGRKQSPLCAECMAELKQPSTQAPSSNWRYVGPVLVRSEPDYHVLSLPDRVGLIVGALADRDCQDFVAAMRPQTAGKGDDPGSRIYCLVKDHVLKEPGKPSLVVNHLKNDGFHFVQRGGPQVFLRACALRYEALGQYAKAVETLQEAIHLDAKDAGVYNHLAWIKATCPDASVRNGSEAVSAATKACELTQWKHGGRIDTLAAAYAEAGDFKRAIEFQEQALRIGNPPDSEQKAMRERLSLYKQSQPFRKNAGKP